MDLLNVSPALFDRQMSFLSRHGYNVITLEKLIEYKESNVKPPLKTVVITFDDGYRDNYVNAFPILEKYNFKGTFLVVTDYIDSDRIFTWLKLGKKSFSHYQENKEVWLPLQSKDIQEMSARGACFGSHTTTHRSLTKISKAEAMEELAISQQRLQEILRKPVYCFSYPYGEAGTTVKNWVKAAGYRAAVLTEGSNNTMRSDFFGLKRITIPGTDSLSAFIRRVEGAYDWVWWFRPLTGFAQRFRTRS
ncbi:MAG: polysaccharide deacetylase family protein [Dehalococcoidales bacterium]|jgi:peptidoglycan/xylan/chitin deacetylase (PgdA/CDA1 family)